MGKKRFHGSKSPKKITLKNEKELEVVNSLADLAYGLNTPTAQVSKQDTLIINNRYNLLFNNRSLLSELYVEHGIVQTLVDQPVDDGLRNGVVPHTKMLDEDEIYELNAYMESENIWRQIGQVIKWSRLFGGGGLVIITSQDPEKEFDIEKVDEDTPLKFYAADLWELNMQYYTANPTEDLQNENPYMFYGKNLHTSRVLRVKGKEAPSFIRRNLRGWGMTEVERLVRSINQYFKNQDLIFELLDEAKVDVYKIKNFNTSLLNSGGTNKIQNRVMSANIIKNYLNALVMDVDDEYDQKQYSFSGLPDMLKQIREGIASDIKMPVTKIFGISSAGFNAGEDDLENYNSMVESEVRAKVKYIIIKVMQVVSKKLFGIIPEDLNVEYRPLRILNTDQEQSAKDKMLTRVLSSFQAGLITAEEAKESINTENLLPIKINVDNEIYEENIPQGGTDNGFEE